MDHLTCLKPTKDCIQVGNGEKRHSSHNFTNMYCPWTNCTVGRVFSEVIKACKVLLSEHKLVPDRLRGLSECTQNIVNESPLQRPGIRKQGNEGDI